MVRNFGKGGKGCKKMKSGNVDLSDRLLLFRENGQDYAVVKEVYGSGRYLCVCCDDKVERLGILRGSMRKRSVHRIGRGDVVLVGLRDYQDSKVDIMHLYISDEVRALVSYNELAHDALQVDHMTSFVGGTGTTPGDEDIMFV